MNNVFTAVDQSTLDALKDQLFTTLCGVTSRRNGVDFYAKMTQKDCVYPEKTYFNVVAAADYQQIRVASSVQVQKQVQQASVLGARILGVESRREIPICLRKRMIINRLYSSDCREDLLIILPRTQ